MMREDQHHSDTSKSRLREGERGSLLPQAMSHPNGGTGDSPTTTTTTTTTTNASTATNTAIPDYQSCCMQHASIESELNTITTTSNWNQNGESVGNDVVAKGYFLQKKSPIRSSSSSCSRNAGTVAIAVAVFLSALLVACLVLLYPHAKGSLLDAYGSGDDDDYVYSSSGSNGSSAAQLEYDYIVVGAGPSGIIAAVKLAQAFPALNILLLEAGTQSQTAVQNNLADLRQRQRRTNSGGDDDEGVCGTVSSSSSSSSRQRQQQQQPSRLNEFDVPLLWSSVASAQGEPSQRTAPSNDYTSGDGGSSSFYSSAERVVAANGGGGVPPEERQRKPPPPQQQQPQQQQQQQQQQPQQEQQQQQQQQHYEYQRHHWPVARTLMGKAVGGSGLHNAMIYIRSLSTDWDQWNITGWDYERHILPEYVRLERYYKNSGDDASDNDDTTRIPRGTDGPIVTASATKAGMDAIAPLFVQSAVNAGVVATNGFNERDPQRRIGVGYYEFNIRHGIRDSVAQAFLGQPATPEDDSGVRGNAVPSNLFVETGVTVTRVLLALQQDDNKAINSSNNNNGTGASGRFIPPPPRAIGVEYARTSGSVAPQRRDRVGQFLLRNGDFVGEVPQILTNSGICDQRNKNDSNEDGTDDTSTSTIQVDLPGVGKNLRDHPVVTIGFEIDAEIAWMGSSIYTIGSEMDEYYWSAMQLNRMMDLERTNQTVRTIDPAIVEDLTIQLGTIGTPGFSAGGFLRSPYAADDDPSPDIQLTVFPRHMEPHVTRQTQQDTRGNLRLLRNKAMLVTVALLKPEARFEVKSSKSPIPLVVFDGDVSDGSVDDSDDETLTRVLNYRLPEIDLPSGEVRYLTELDVKRLAWGLEQVRRIQSAAPLSNHSGPEIYPGAHLRGKKLLGYVRQTSLPNAHWAGTTRMGSSTDDIMAVVDEHLRVRKVDGLRIVDAGVLPAVPNGNIHSTVCVVASRAADLIANDRMIQEKKVKRGRQQ